MSPLTGNQSTDINMLIGKVPYLKLYYPRISLMISSPLITVHSPTLSSITFGLNHPPTDVLCTNIISTSSTAW